MALLTFKKNTETQVEEGASAQGAKQRTRSAVSFTKSALKSAAVPEKTQTVVLSFNPAFSCTLVTPRISEKASLGAERRVYTFTIARTAGKADVARALRELYGVTPLKIAVCAVPRKRKFVRGKRGETTLGKKAMVYLKEGDTIETL